MSRICLGCMGVGDAANSNIDHGLQRLGTNYVDLQAWPSQLCRCAADEDTPRLSTHQ